MRKKLIDSWAMCLPDLFGDVGQEGIFVLDPQECVQDLLAQVGLELLESASALAVQRDLVACVMIAEDEPGE